MANYVPNPTWADGSGGGTPITAAKLNNYEAGITAAHFAPAAHVYHATNQTTTTGVPFTFAFDTERFDTDTIHDTVTNNSRLTCKTAGKYQITGSIAWDVNATGLREARLFLNGTTVIGKDYRMTVTTALESTYQTVTVLWDMAVNDYVELLGRQLSGGNLAATGTSSGLTQFMMARVA